MYCDNKSYKTLEKEISFSEVRLDKYTYFSIFIKLILLRYCYNFGIGFVSYEQYRLLN